MTANAYFKLPKVLRRLYEGPLGDYVDLYAAQLLREGHCYQSGRRCIRIVADRKLCRTGTVSERPKMVWCRLIYANDKASSA